MDKHFTPCVFIADDNPNNIKVLSSMLEEKGYDIRVALNGEQALQSIRQSKPDLILLDVHMPKMDGYEVCDALKKDDELKDISVIFISALSEPFNKIQGFKLGAVDYIEKPFQIEEVEVRIETQLQLRYYQMRLKEKAKDSEERLELAAEAGNIGVWEWRTDSDIMLWDDRMLNIYGIKEHAFQGNGDAWFARIQERDRERVKKEITACLFENNVFETEFQIIKPDNTIGFVSVRAGIHPLEDDNEKKVIGVTQDITDRVLAEENKKIMEDQLRQSQKMESMGTLAGGIAHDFNNILSGIFGYSLMIKENCDNPEKVEKNIDQVIKGARRATALVKQILTYTRKEESDKHPVRVDSLINEVADLILPSIPGTISFKTNLSSTSTILANSTQIHQVIMNLCANANQSMADSGGELVITLNDSDISQTTVFGSGKLTPGKYITIDVSDTGKGIDKENIEKIFDPYFTSKEPGEGTGLGLSVVLGIVQDHNGVIKASSCKGEGSLFRIYFPVTE